MAEEVAGMHAGCDFERDGYPLAPLGEEEDAVRHVQGRVVVRGAQAVMPGSPCALDPRSSIAHVNVWDARGLEGGGHGRSRRT